MQMRFVIGGIAAIAVASVSLVAPLDSTQAQSVTANAAPVCMTKTLDDGGEFAIILPASDEAGMTAKGFIAEPCTEKFATQKQREAYRDSICGIASAWREELQRHFERVRGERPAVLCGMAEIAVAQWQREGAE